VADGSLVLAVAFGEFGDELAAGLPATAATRHGGGWRLEGAKHLVPMAHVADRLLVSARTGPDACGVFLVERAAAGVTLETTETTARELRSTVRLRQVVVADDAVIGDPAAGADVVAATTKRLLAGLCATQAGVSAEALRLTAAHVSEREQFGQKIATFQAVAQRAADAYIDVEAIT
jgi:alkylation response protein AidB-like acyl-CoA dehydrogenase